jgi:hypothetical protein
MLLADMDFSSPVIPANEYVYGWMMIFMIRIPILVLSCLSDSGLEISLDLNRFDRLHSLIKNTLPER